ncbi:hypothetical protein Ato02nite_079200 [Paractinoplanes toevensis]|uniref:GH26 domain-containing protein n=2 Tax=Paractinoplanes toevensis TaxID=571911 RepID=A0A919W9J3_9ACTN|nr:hypothetical protein Ato02nite_079200 [Actinoplanes toevensis]
MVATVLVAGVGAVPAQAAAAEPATRFGVIATTQGRAKDDAATYQALYEEQRTRYGGPIGIRLFSAGRLPLPGDGTMPGTLLTWAAATHPDEAITLSHKTRDEARLPALLDWARDHRVRLSLIYFHEVQDNWFKHRDARADPAVYLDIYRSYRRIIQAHRARSLITLEKNLMWYWQHYNAAKLGGDWRAFVEKKNDPADVVSWDTYAFPGMPTALGRYATPDEFFRYPRDVWRETGRPWAIGEIGSTVQDGVGPGAEKAWDPDGAKFVAWVRAMTAAASKPAGIGPAYQGVPAARFMKWWAGHDRNGSDQSLDQVPAAVAAYRGSVAAARL